MTKLCSDCKNEIIPGDKGARGMCHACYEKWRYHNTPNVKAVNKRSHQKHRAKRLEGQKKWRDENPEVKAASDRRYYENNREKLKQYQKDYRAKNQQKLRDQHLQRMFGVSIAEFELLLQQQGGGCAICGGKETYGNKKNLNIDHCHKTGRVRGILCSKCNKAIGLLMDDPMLLQLAIAYLQKHNEQDFSI
jgi:hypothetical protein